MGPMVVILLLVTVNLALLVVGIPLVRWSLVSGPLMRWMARRKVLPGLSPTERTALEAGTVWVEADLFRGRPDFARLHAEPIAPLRDDERRFLDVQCVTLASLASDWEISQLRDLPAPVWAYLREQRFFGMIIPPEYGGLGFSARAQSEVLARLAAHSTALCVTCMVPNSLGPAELLLHYGTTAQKDRYLPRLARGEEIPCFALTEPNAGSDAGSIVSSGVVFGGADGRPYLRLSWNKRYITLAPVATLIGLAVRLRDPGNLLGKGVEPGITCVLVPASAPGVEIGRRHDPLGVPFLNGPVEGHDVVVSADQIIGGAEGAGRGWQMLMESLAAGRSLSLPSQAVGGAKGLLRVASAYAVVRRQFGQPIGRFEGIEEPLARLAGLTYLMDAARVYTAGALDRGVRPAVVSAIVKVQQTELSRRLVNDAMDILGGAGITRGPRNLVANGYAAMPISITVEGANILTRSMIIFGQGALRCHPYAYREVRALEARDGAAFDQALWGHVRYVVQNVARAVLLSVSYGWSARVPRGPLARYYRRLARASASFAVLADLAMLGLGGSLKRREKLTGRYADVLSWMYLMLATLHRFQAEGAQATHLPVARWALEYALARIEEGFDGILANFDAPVLGALVRGPLRAWSRLHGLGTGPRDALGHRLAEAVQQPGGLRDALTEGLLPALPAFEAAHRLERAFRLCAEAAPVLDRIAAASRRGALPRRRPLDLVLAALDARVIDVAEATLLEAANQAREDAIQVDAFPADDRRAVVPSDEARTAGHDRRVYQRRTRELPATPYRRRAGDPPSGASRAGQG